jgi:hypothetical protein
MLREEIAREEEFDVTEDDKAYKKGAKVKGQ